MASAMACVAKPADAMLRKTKMCKFYAKGTCTKGDACNYAHSHLHLEGRPDLQKTSLCMAFERNGVCRDGNACKYAHGAYELRAAAKTAPAAAQISARSLQHGDVSQDHSTTSLSSLSQILHGLSKSADMQPTCMNSAIGATAELCAPDFSRQTTAEAERGISRQSTTCSSTRSTSPESSAGRHTPGMDSASPGMSRQTTSESQGEVNKVPDMFLLKTKMCKFFALGVCSKGAACKFAHEKGMLQPQPNLYRTSLCLAFMRNSTCKDGANCRYAHGAEQLRTGMDHDESQNSSVGVEQNESGECQEPVEAPLLPSLQPPAVWRSGHLTTLETLAGIATTQAGLPIKNTFIHFDKPSTLKATLSPRSKSANGRLISTR